MNRALERFALALVVLALFGGAVFVMSFFNVPERNRDVIVQLVGGVNTLASIVLGYYFGSSARHDDLKIMRRPSEPQEGKEP